MTLACLRQLLEITPLPPRGADVDALLASFEAVYAAREVVLAGAGPVTIESPEAQELLFELARRDEAWAAALSEALSSVGTARQNLGRLRSYAR
jgi:hypothetical protein